MNNEEKILQMLAAIQNEQIKTNERLDDVESRLNTRLDRIEGDVADIKHGQAELVRFQQNDLVDALDFLYNRAATKDDVQVLNAKLGVLNDRMFAQEAKLKLAK